LQSLSRHPVRAHPGLQTPLRWPDGDPRLLAHGGGYWPLAARMGDLPAGPGAGFFLPTVRPAGARPTPITVGR